MGHMLYRRRIPEIKGPSQHNSFQAPIPTQNNNNTNNNTNNINILIIIRVNMKKVKNQISSHSQSWISAQRPGCGRDETAAVEAEFQFDRVLVSCGCQARM